MCLRWGQTHSDASLSVCVHAHRGATIKSVSQHGTRVAQWVSIYMAGRLLNAFELLYYCLSASAGQITKLISIIQVSARKLVFIAAALR
jgi:hypothetical protein